jgi:hypothetical protein
MARLSASRWLPAVVLAAILFLHGALGQAVPKRLPVPAADAQAKAEKLIRDLFKDDYGKKKPADQLALTAKLLDQAKETKDDPAARFVLLREVRDLAVQAGDLTQALRIVDDTAREYEVNPAALQATVLETASALPATPTLSKAIAETALDVVEEAVSTDDFEAAARLLKVAEAAAQKAKSIPLVSAAHAKGKQAEAVRKEFEQAKVAAEKLAKDPKDAEASAAYGKYLCLRKGDWDKGLPFLLEGNDAKLKELAVKELRNPSEPADQIDLAEGWMGFAGKQPEPEKTALLMRTYNWFRQARPKVTGLKTKVDKAMASLPRHYLTDLDEFDVKLGPWKFGKGETGCPTPTLITIGGKRSPLSLCLHAPANDYSAVKYRLGKSAKLFKTRVAIDESTPGSLTPLTFVVLGDGKLLWTSQPVKVSGNSQLCNISVTGVDVLELRAQCPGRYEGAYAVWVEPYVLR